MAGPAFASYEEFFAFYLHEHSDPRNRLMHAAGTLFGLCMLVIPFVLGHPIYRPAFRVAQSFPLRQNSQHE